MRLAFVVGSAYEKNGQLPLLSSAEIDGLYLARLLGLEDVEATVVELPAERGVAERIEQALTDQPGPIESVLVVFVGYGVFSKDRGAALLLDGDRLGTFSFVRLRSLLERYAAASCVIAEVFLIGDGAADLSAASDAIHGALTERHARGTCGVIAVRPSEGVEANEPALAAMVTTALLAWNPWFDPKLERRLRRVQAPTLVLWGEHDRLIPPVYGQAFRNAIPGAALEVVPDCGHMAPIERPEAIAKAIGRFVGGALGS